MVSYFDGGSRTLIVTVFLAAVIGRARTGRAHACLRSPSSDSGPTSTDAKTEHQ